MQSFSALALSDCLSEIGTDPSANSMDPSLARNTPPGHCRVQVPQLIQRCLLTTKQSEIVSVGHVRIAGQSGWFRHLVLVDPDNFIGAFPDMPILYFCVSHLLTISHLCT